MGRKKSHPVRSGGLLPVVPSSKGCNREYTSANSAQYETADVKNVDGDSLLRRYFYVDVDSSLWASDEHFDIAEVVLKDIKFTNGFTEHILIDGLHMDLNISLRFKLPDMQSVNFRLGHWSFFSTEDIFLEFLDMQKHSSEDSYMPKVLFSGVFDGPDISVSSLAHLVSMKFMTLRPIFKTGISLGASSLSLRVEILKNAFNACGSLLEVARHPWRKSMINVMSWLRPEVTTSEAKYATKQFNFKEGCIQSEDDNVVGRLHSEFDVAHFYEAIRPSKEAPELEDELPDLVPQLRPYQRRAAHWMVCREKGKPDSSSGINKLQLFSPLCVPIVFLEGNSGMFYNPFSGGFSLHPESSSSYVSGGILADEMGLGKTVELLACIFAHRKTCKEDCIISNDESRDHGSLIKRLKRERVECVCGDVTENVRYKGLWVQCDICDAWQHADCVDFSPKEKSSYSHEDSTVMCENNYSHKKRQRKKQRYPTSVVSTSENFSCSICSELIEAANTTISTGATLIVCPSPILSQWNSEIIRHTKPNSLKVHIYEGARNLSSLTNLQNDLSALACSDIVLTTYDVLKEDLSHDSDRHDGDRRSMRFQKRYPVIPTLLTRISWWRVCLDEAQMVESNAAAMTEMALRLHAQHRWCITGTPIQRRLDDLYGLLHFLRAAPFDVYRWWAEVIRDPYERKDVVAMEFTHEFFKEIMWRSSKVHVSDELQLPPQEDCTSWLIFSPIEEHFYQKQHESCLSIAHEAIQRFKNDNSKRKFVSERNAPCDAFLSHADAAKLLSPLLKLRQACCHPQVGSSGLRSLQQSPMSMDEILEVLISKAKIEGEESLRKVVVALNGLAAISVIEKNYKLACSLYKEALSIAKENSNDFRLDPLLSLHVHHNLADLLPLTTEKVCPLDSQTADMSRGEIREDISSCSASNRFISAGYLQSTCENIRQKYLSVFSSKLSLAQQEFGSIYRQVCDMSKEFQHHTVNWWLEALDLIYQGKNSADELIKRIDQAISKASNGTGSSRASSRYRSISGLKLSIQSSLDSLETCRHAMIQSLIEIDNTMEKPKEADILRVRYCPSCQSGDGPLCVHCELNDLFQEYEARLFHLKKGNYMMASAEEAIDLQKKRNKLNLFFRDYKNHSGSGADDIENKGQRHGTSNVVVYRSPSDLEVILEVIKRYSKSILGRQGMSAARKHLLLFEARRKEFAYARSLSSAQARMLSAHDEINMATSRLRLRGSEDEATAIDVLSEDQLIPSNMQFSSDKFLSLSSLARIKGQLRYLKGLATSKNRPETSTDNSSKLQDSQDPTSSIASSPSEIDWQSKTEDHLCPICHEKIKNQKMVFQCGHFTCCKCCLEMTEHAVLRLGKSQKKWVMCPTCRQHTDFGNIAFVDDKQSEACELKAPKFVEGEALTELSLKVEGSYGTKIEAVTRRILWICHGDPNAKILVFSSWNDVLNLMEHALHENNISYIRMKGGRKSQAAISQFKGQESIMAESNSQDTVRKSNSVRVLLLLIQHGANGLNILEAQHVILVEPLLNIASEAQAINRVHRIGQEKKTVVHRFVVENTVEKSIYKLNKTRNVNFATGTKSKHQDQPALTLKDIESIFQPILPKKTPETDSTEGSLRHLPPQVAAGLAADRRLTDSS